MWSSMNRLFSGGSDAVHMRMSIVARRRCRRAASRCRAAARLRSRAGRPMNSTLTRRLRQRSPDRCPRTGRPMGEEALGGVATAEPRVSRGRFMAEAERLIQERPQEGPAQAEPGRRPDVAHERPVGARGSSCHRRAGRPGSDDRRSAIRRVCAAGGCLCGGGHDSVLSARNRVYLQPRPQRSRRHRR